MNNFIIKNYLKRITLNDLVRYAKKFNINYENEELEYVYDVIKNKTDLIFNNPEKILIEAKNILSSSNFNLLYELYINHYHKLNH